MKKKLKGKNLQSPAALHRRSLTPPTEWCEWVKMGIQVRKLTSAAINLAHYFTDSRSVYEPFKTALSVQIS